MRTKPVIRDIRYYGNGYGIPVAAHAVSDRIARKLREYGLVLGSFDHLYLNLTTDKNQDDMSVEDDGPEQWLRYLDYGMAAKTFKRLSDTAKSKRLTEATFRALKFLCKGDSKRLSIIRKVEKQLRVHGSELKILARSMQTPKHRVSIKFQVKPQGKHSLGWIEYENKQTGQRGEIAFIKLRFYEDIYPIAGKISVAGNLIRLMPLNSAKASLYTSRYKVPVEIPIEKILESDA